MHYFRNMFEYEIVIVTKLYNEQCFMTDFWRNRSHLRSLCRLIDQTLSFSNQTFYETQSFCNRSFYCIFWFFRTYCVKCDNNYIIPC